MPPSSYRGRNPLSRSPVTVYRFRKPIKRPRQPGCLPPTNNVPKPFLFLQTASPLLKCPRCSPVLHVAQHLARNSLASSAAYCMSVQLVDALERKQLARHALQIAGICGQPLRQEGLCTLHLCDLVLEIILLCLHFLHNLFQLLITVSSLQHVVGQPADIQ
jgi:hypothetical protein